MFKMHFTTEIYLNINTKELDVAKCAISLLSLFAASWAVKDDGFDKSSFFYDFLELLVNYSARF